jgi:hypothetical protein
MLLLSQSTVGLSLLLPMGSTEVLGKQGEGQKESELSEICRRGRVYVTGETGGRVYSNRDTRVVHVSGGVQGRGGIRNETTIWASIRCNRSGTLSISENSSDKSSVILFSIFGFLVWSLFCWGFAFWSSGKSARPPKSPFRDGQGSSGFYLGSLRCWLLRLLVFSLVGHVQFGTSGRLRSSSSGRFLLLGYSLSLLGES